MQRRPTGGCRTRAGRWPWWAGTASAIAAASEQEVTDLVRRGTTRAAAASSSVRRRRASAQPPRRPVQDLREAGHKVQSRLDPAAHRIDPEPAVPVEQPGPLDNSDHADVSGTAEIVTRQRVVIRCAQAFQTACPGHDAHPLLLFPALRRVLHDSQGPKVPALTGTTSVSAPGSCTPAPHFQILAIRAPAGGRHRQTRSDRRQRRAQPNGLVLHAVLRTH